MKAFCIVITKILYQLVRITLISNMMQIANLIPVKQISSCAFKR